MKIEMHIHTRYSKDSLLTLTMLLLMCKMRKINCIAITDHNEIEGALKAEKYFKKYGVDVIVGEEISTNDGEVIGLFLKEKVPNALSLEETIDLIYKQEGFVYVPHPYDDKRYKTVIKYEKIISNKDKIHLIECFNGRNVEIAFEKKQTEIANEIQKIKIIGSDAHVFFEVGRNYMEIEEFSNKQEFLESLKNAIFYKKKCLNVAHIFTKYIKFIKSIVRGEFNEICGIIVRKFKKRNK